MRTGVVKLTWAGGLCVGLVGALLGVAWTPTANPTAAYRVALTVLPKAIDPWNDEFTQSRYLYPAIFYPLFDTDENGKVVSEFLDMSRTQATGPAFDRYQLCLRPGIRFTDGSEIQVADLKTTLRGANKRDHAISEIRSIIGEKDCLQVELAAPEPEFFRHLGNVDSTILKTSTIGQRIPVGLGPYRISLLTPERAFLEAVPGRVSGDFQSLEFVQVNLAELEGNPREDIDDWNALSPMWTPEKYRQYYTKVRRPSMTVAAVFINLFDAKLRMKLVQCLDMDSYITAVRAQVVRQNSVFPDGIIFGRQTPSVAPSKKPECPIVKGPRKTLLYYSSGYRRQELESYFAAMDPRLPVHIKVAVYPIARKDADWLAGKELMGSGNYHCTEPSPENCLSNYINPNVRQFPNLEKEIAQMSRELQPFRKRALAVQAEQEILETGYIVPMGFYNTALYYRPDLVNIAWHGASNPCIRYERLQRRHGPVKIQNFLSTLAQISPF